MKELTSAERQELEALRHESLHNNAYIDTLHDWIKSDSVYSILRYADKSPSIVGGDDSFYVDMYNLCNQLREKDRQENEFRKEAFEQSQP